MSTLGNHRTSVSALMGAPVLDSEGKAMGSVREFAVVPLEDATRVFALVVKASFAGAARGRLLVTVSSLELNASGRLQLRPGYTPETLKDAEDFLLLERDLLDQQIIDVNGHKVVRVNDVDMVWETVPRAGHEQDGHHDRANCNLVLRIAEVEVGLRGAARRMLKGLPGNMVEGISNRIRAAIIPWDFVDLIDRDPARRVRLKIEQDRLSSMHPSDLADILEELAPAERQALFSSLDEEVAAETLEEVELKTQMNLIESLDSERVAGILEEMDPGAAADLLSELPEERSDAILEEMDEQDRHDLEELLEYSPDSAAGLMTTEFLAVVSTRTVEDAVRELGQFEGDLESITDVFLTDEAGLLIGVIPLPRLMLAARERPLDELNEGRLVSTVLEANGRKVAELFDKYNLRCLPVLDESRMLAGVVHAEHVIAWLRTGH